MKRRELLMCGGMALGGIMAGLADAETGKAGEAEAPEWGYVPIDPVETAKKAYELYKDGSCMYASFRSIVESVGEARCQIHPSEALQWGAFPYYMTYYGKGGIHGYGTVCGILNGCAAAICLLVPDSKEAKALTMELFKFYETTPLPHFVPENPKFTDIPQTVSESVICHVSVSRWTAEADETAESPRRKERCMRLVADCVAKAVELLNAHWEAKKGGGSCPAFELGEPAASCTVCHNPEGEMPGTNVKMNCSVCHDQDEDHGRK